MARISVEGRFINRDPGDLEDLMAEMIMVSYKQTWNLEIPLKIRRRHIYKATIFGFHVCRGCIPKTKRTIQEAQYFSEALLI